MKPFRLPPAVAKPIKNYLASTVPALVAPLSPAAGLALDENWTTSSPPFIGVFDDGGLPVWPVSVRPRIRVTVWADGQDNARTIAGMCLGVLLSHSIPGIATVTDPTGLTDARDPHNHGIMCFFSVTAQARTLAA
jgi:hypothetical protein